MLVGRNLVREKSGHAGSSASNTLEDPRRKTLVNGGGHMLGGGKYVVFPGG